MVELDSGANGTADLQASRSGGAPRQQSRQACGINLALKFQSLNGLPIALHERLWKQCGPPGQVYTRQANVE